MKLETESRLCLSKLNGEVYSPKIDSKNLPLLYKFLRAKYKEPLKSAFREILSNAIDANTEAKVSSLIHIHLPSEEEPYLEITDRGIGISPERFQNVFLSYLESTKRETNSQIGGYGIGSKSPFSYTDQFFIITRTEGIEYTYLAYIDSKGSDLYTLLSTQPSQSPSGTTVRIPILTNDFDKVITYYKEFSKTILLTNSLNLSVEPLTKDYETELGYIVPQYPERYAQVNVVNPLGIVYKSFLIEEILTKYCTYLKVPIGLLELDLTREEILHNDKNKELLNTLYKQYCKQIEDIREKKLKSAKGLKEQLEIIDKCPINNFPVDLSLNGKKVSRIVSLSKNIFTEYIRNGKGAYRKNNTHKLVLNSNTRIVISDYVKIPKIEEESFLVNNYRIVTISSKEYGEHLGSDYDELVLAKVVPKNGLKENTKRVRESVPKYIQVKGEKYPVDLRDGEVIYYVTPQQYACHLRNRLLKEGKTVLELSLNNTVNPGKGWLNIYESLGEMFSKRELLAGAKYKVLSKNYKEPLEIAHYLKKSIHESLREISPIMSNYLPDLYEWEKIPGLEMTYKEIKEIYISKINEIYPEINQIGLERLTKYMEERDELYTYRKELEFGSGWRAVYSIEGQLDFLSDLQLD